jgi:hypothetical protein
MLILRASNLGHDRIAHGFFGRRGGVSEGIFGSLNCGPGSGDDLAAVAENRRRVTEALGGGSLVTLYQVHSAEAVTVREAWERGPQADAMATNVPGLALGILTADCAPVLLADAEAGVIGAAHAGWKGALSGVVESAIAQMEALGANRTHIVAAVGPCIGQRNYEVGPEFHARFAAVEPGSTRFFLESERPGHWHFDLEAYVAARSFAAGLNTVERLSACTYADANDFFSYRRATHQGGTEYGRQIAAILLRE